MYKVTIIQEEKIPTSSTKMVKRHKMYTRKQLLIKIISNLIHKKNETLNI